MRNTYLKHVSLVLCGALLLVTAPSKVLAGAVPVVETDSSITGQGGGFANDALASFALGGQISAALANSLQIIASQGQVTVGGQTLNLTPEEVQAFNALFSGGAEAEAAADFLVEQISDDIGVDLEIDLISASGGNLEIVVDNFNTLIDSLSRPQLILALRSAPLQAILQSLQAAIAATDSEDEEDLVVNGNAPVLILLRLL